MNEKGFSLIEAVLAAAILGICVLAGFGFMTFYSRMVSGIHKEQRLFTEADSLLEAFRSKDFCNQQLSILWPGFPASAYTASTDKFTFSRLNWGGNEVRLPQANFPEFPEGFIEQIDLQFNGALGSDIFAQSARITVYFYLQSSRSLKKRTMNIFLALNPLQQITSCMDTHDLLELDWQQIVCKKTGHSLQKDYSCTPVKVVENVVCEVSPSAPRCLRRK